MRRQDREEPAAVLAREKAAGANCPDCRGTQGSRSCRLCHGRGWITKEMAAVLAGAAADRAACRRSKAALPADQYRAFVGAARQERTAVLSGLEVAGHSVSKKSRELVAAGIESELGIIAGLRSGDSQAAPEFAEGNVQEAFA